MRPAIKALLWTAALFVVVPFFIGTAAALHVRSAVKDGALDSPVFGCIEPIDAQRHEQLLDRAIIRGVQGHGAPVSRSSMWHLKGAFAFLGVHLNYTAKERKRLMLPKLKALPLCGNRYSQP